MFLYIDIKLVKINDKQYHIYDSFTYYEGNKVMNINDAPWP